jgi:hypothetical protein
MNHIRQGAFPEYFLWYISTLKVEKAVLPVVGYRKNEKSWKIIENIEVLTEWLKC